VLAEDALYLAAQGNLLCLAGAVWSLIFHVRFLDRRAPTMRVASLGAGGVAMFSYEFGALLPLLVVLVEVVLQRQGRRLTPGPVARLGPFAALLGAYLAVRTMGIDAAPSGDWWGGSWLASLGMQLRLWVEAWGLMFMPVGLLPRYEPVDVPSVITTAVAALLHLGLAAAVVTVARRRPASVLPVAVVWWYVAQAPTCNLALPNLGFPFALRFLFLASVLPIAAFSAWFAARTERRPLLWLLPAVVLVAFLPANHALVSTWRSPRALFGALAAHRPDDFLAQLNLCTSRLLAGDLDGAEQAGSLACRLGPGDAKGYFLLGEVARRRGNIPAARGLYREALARHMVHLPARLELGRLELAAGNAGYMRRGILPLVDMKGISALNQARAQVLLAAAALSLDAPGEAADRARSAIETWPHDAGVAFDAATVLRRCGRIDQSRELFRRAVDLAGEEIRSMVGDVRS
jgi:tetratricopeptide (TPR) repeat protein